ncbi:DUF2721 domain-containing protein [soil metagenome]
MVFTSFNMFNDTTTLTALSAMITPAVLILATGQLILTTSQRLARAMDRARKISEKIEELDQNNIKTNKKKKVLFYQLLYGSARRSRRLQQAMSILYLALSIFVCTSITIGLLEVFGFLEVWVPVTLGLLGISFLFYATIILITETKIAYWAVDKEMRYFIDNFKEDIPDKIKNMEEEKTI